VQTVLRKFSFLVVAFIGLSAQAQPSFVSADPVKTTAISLYLTLNPDASLANEYDVERIDQIEAEVTALFNSVLTPAGRSYFARLLPWETGKVLI